MTDDRPAANGRASWRVCFEAGPLWYIKLDERSPPPYLRQIHVEAIVDVDANGRAAGIEIIDSRMPAPPDTPETARKVSRYFGWQPDAIYFEKLHWAADKPEWLAFYRKFYDTEEGRLFLEWLARTATVPRQPQA